MSALIKAPETGTVIGRAKSWRGAMVSVAVTLSESEWVSLTRDYVELWQDAEDDLEVRGLTLDERIALFVIGQAEGWCERISGRLGNDLDDDVPF